jgi:hypothetical protein
MIMNGRNTSTSLLDNERVKRMTKLDLPLFVIFPGSHLWPDTVEAKVVGRDKDDCTMRSGNGRSQGIPGGKDRAENAVGSPRMRLVLLPMRSSSFFAANVRGWVVWVFLKK